MWRPSECEKDIAPGMGDITTRGTFRFVTLTVLTWSRNSLLYDRMFLAMHTTAHNCMSSWTAWILTPCSSPFLLRSSIILFSYLRPSSKWSHALTSSPRNPNQPNTMRRLFRIVTDSFPVAVAAAPCRVGFYVKLDALYIMSRFPCSPTLTRDKCHVLYFMSSKYTFNL